MPSRPRRYVCLLRGINLGARNRVPMARLREACERIGAANVRTLIASGNVVLDSEFTAPQLKTKLEGALQAEFGFPIVVVVLTATQIRDVVRRNPFPGADARSIHVAFSTGPIPAPVKRALEGLTATEERAAVIGQRIYLFLPHGFGGAALPGMGMSKMTPPVTIRTWQTVAKLNEMASAPTISS